MFSLMANCFTWIKLRREPIKKVTILMIGLDNAGKTSTVADLKGDTLDGITPTVGFLMTSFLMQRFNVTIFDLGGGQKIRAIWTNYYPEVYGIVFCVDASDRTRLEESRVILHATKSSSRVTGKPLLILANKQDIKGAMTEEEIYHGLDLGTLIAQHKCPCQVYTCTAVLGQGNKIDRQIKKGFRWLLSEISSNYSNLTQRVERDTAEQNRITAEERKKKFERIRKEREAREKAEQEAAQRERKKEEESDDDVVVGKEKTSKKDTSSPEQSTPEKKKKKKKKKKIPKEKPLDSVNENASSSRIEEATVREPRDLDGLHRRLRPLDSLEDRDVERPGKLAPLGVSQQSLLTEDAEVKKKKKKKKRKANKTAPLEEDVALQTRALPAVSAWATPPGTLNGFPGGSTASPRRLEPLGPNFFLGGATFAASHIQESDEDPKHLAAITTKTWTRTRPNSEDYDLVT